MRQPAAELETMCVEIPNARWYRSSRPGFVSITVEDWYEILSVVEMCRIYRTEYDYLSFNIRSELANQPQKVLNEISQRYTGLSGTAILTDMVTRMMLKD